MTTVTTGIATDAQSRLARDALRSQRQRLPELFRGLRDDEWKSPSRCTEWSVHEVVRHLCDVTLLWLDLLRGEPFERVAPGGIDPRTTPLAWLERSATECPADTIAVFEDASAEIVDLVESIVASNRADRVDFAYGTIPWSTLVLHLFWDAWVHERDVLIPLGRPQESPEVESTAAAAHGLLMSGLPFKLLHRPLDETVVLDGAGGGVFRLAATDDTVTVARNGSDESDDALRGPLPDVVDSLVGREPELAKALHGPPERVEPLGMFRRFMFTPGS